MIIKGKQWKVNSRRYRSGKSFCARGNDLVRYIYNFLSERLTYATECF